MSILKNGNAINVSINSKKSCRLKNNYNIFDTQMKQQIIYIISTIVVAIISQR